MRILSITRGYHLIGGAESYAFALAELLTQAGHTVIPFTTQNSHNLPSPYSKYFAPESGFDEYSLPEKFRFILGSSSLLYLTRLLDNEPIDLIHIHTLHRSLVTPEVLVELKRRRKPVIVTLHDYKMVCPTYRLYIDSSNQICERCINGRFYNVVFTDCVFSEHLKKPKGMLLAIEAYWIKHSQVYINCVDRYIAPSKYVAEKCSHYPISSDKLTVANHFVTMSAFKPVPPLKEAYFLFAGRMVSEKGVIPLINVFLHLSQNLKLAGDGPLYNQARVQCQGARNITILGRITNEKVQDFMQESFATIVPSLWPDNSPMVIYESFSRGIPVIASDVGGIPELITHGHNGLLVEPGNEQALASAIIWMAEHPEERDRMARNAYSTAQERFRPEDHLQSILQIYTDALVNHDTPALTYNGSK
jgi:glycosyltransferase involved in cell wall biosynthesis